MTKIMEPLPSVLTMIFMDENVSSLILTILWIGALLFPVATGTCAIPLVMVSPMSTSSDAQFSCEMDDGTDASMRSMLQPISENPERLFLQGEFLSPHLMEQSLIADNAIVPSAIFFDQSPKPPQVTYLG